ncbi:pilus assembly protein PilM [Pseudomonas entomophila]|uniref:type IV pilus biogenesis protein PilM n=1 Tax=Pseudomonas entomophila TaxID=312306 RepID=UPI0015E3AEBE|nr:pilus assembly protein PilM [Pseudomonas entomophila]MBA1194149.1 pilus assembly protein PilM [Pseudomonas entomophila]
MLGCFNRGCSSVVGLEMEGDCVRMVRVRRHQGRVHLQGWAIESCPGTPVTTPGAPVTDSTAMALRQARQQVGEGRLVVSLPASQVIVKPRQVPQGLDEDAMEAWLLADADRFVPFSLDEVALDFCITDASRSASDGLEVWVAACRQAQLDELTSTLDGAGLKASIVEVDAVALWRLTNGLPGQRPALMRLQERRATLYAWPVEQAPQSYVLAMDEQGNWLQAARHWLAPRLDWPGVDALGVLGADARRYEAIAAQLAVPCCPIDPWADVVLDGVERPQGGSEALSCLALASCLAVRGLER